MDAVFNLAGGELTEGRTEDLGEDEVAADGVALAELDDDEGVDSDGPLRIVQQVNLLGGRDPLVPGQVVASIISKCSNNESCRT